MGLQAKRQVEATNVSYITPYTQERGGVLTYGSASGMTIVEYAFDPSGALPVGLQLNDVEHMNLTLQPDRTYHPGLMTDGPCSTVGIATQGDYITDWVYIIGEVQSGDPAYVGPSGTVTNLSTLGGIQIGRFLSDLTIDPHLLTMRGFGFSRQFVDTCTKVLTWENNPADRTLVLSEGWIEIRIDPSKIIRSQLEKGL